MSDGWHGDGANAVDSDVLDAQLDPKMSDPGFALQSMSAPASMARRSSGWSGNI